MKKIQDLIEKMPENDLKFYGSVLSLAIIIFASVLAYMKDESVYYVVVSYPLFYLAFIILVYVTHFKILQFWTGVFWSAVVALVTGIILVVYLIFVKADSQGFVLPIAFITQLVVAKVVKYFLGNK